MSTAKFTPTIHRVELGKRVLVVATNRPEGWCAYCLPVAGKSHDAEQGEVLRRGAKLPEHYARPMFPVFDEIEYAQ